MALSINRVFIVGRVGSVSELRYTKGELAVINVSVATSGGTKEKPQTEWHRLVCFGKLAEWIGSQSTKLKGKVVSAEGKLYTRQYEKDGQKHYATEITTDTFITGGDGAAQNEPEKAKPEAMAPRAFDAVTPAFTEDDIPF